MKLTDDMLVVDFVIWSPRWHDRKVLLADYKIGTHNKITFPKAPSLAGDWYISGQEAKTFPLEQMTTRNGGKMTMRAVPIDALKPVEKA